jgi:hypothetical protein
LALHNLSPYESPHLQLDLLPVRHLWEQTYRALESSAFTLNPWDPTEAPRLHF